MNVCSALQQGLAWCMKRMRVAEVFGWEVKRSEGDSNAFVFVGPHHRVKQTRVVCPSRPNSANEVGLGGQLCPWSGRLLACRTVCFWMIPHASVIRPHIVEEWTESASADILLIYFEWHKEILYDI
jgi:hypothetical protein